MGRSGLLTVIALLVLATTRQGAAAGDPEAGAQVFRTCAMRYCSDTYEITKVAGQTIPFSEFNPASRPTRAPRDRPALLPASMMGDRTFVIFAAPEEVSGFIESKC